MQEVAERRRDGEKDLMQRIQVIHTISGGPTLAGTSNNSRKNHARKIPRFNADHEILKVSSGSWDLSRSTKIIFTEEDVYTTVQPHDDPMVITVQIANCLVHRFLIDTGSSVDILFKRAHEQLNLKNSCFNSCTSLLYGFTGDSVMPMGTKILSVIVGEAPFQQNIMTEFIVVDTPSTYNAILGRPYLSGIRGVLSIYHNVLKFPVGSGVGEVRGDQQVARNCYAVSTNPATFANQYASVASYPDPRTTERDDHVLEEGEVPDIVVEESEEEERGWSSGYP